MKKYLVSIVIVAVCFTTVAQVGIGTTTPDPSAMLDVVSTNKGLLFPRVPKVEGIATPANGLIVYDLSKKCLRSYQNGSWSICYGKTLGAVAAITNCDKPITTGILADNRTANGVSFTVNYVGGNGGVYAGEIVSSTNVVGVTATLDPGTFNVGAGSVTYNLSGTPSTEGTTTFSINLGGQACIVDLTVFCEPLTSPVAAVVEVTSATGKVWMDRNLGATQVATAFDDDASYGGLYQWGRTTDGHENRRSCLVQGPVTSGDEGYNFIQPAATGVGIGGARDWLDPRDDFRWNTGTEAAPVKNVANDPCPVGFRVPTEAEFIEEAKSWATFTGLGAFASPLKFSFGGYRSFSSSTPTESGSQAYYWTSKGLADGIASSDGWARTYTFRNSPNAVYTGRFNRQRTNGFSIRCIKE